MNTTLQRSIWQYTSTSKNKKRYGQPVSPVRVLCIIVLIPLPCPLHTCCCPPLSHGGSNSSCHGCAGTAVCSAVVRCSSWTLLCFIPCEPSNRNYNSCLKPPRLNLPATVNKIKTNLFICLFYKYNTYSYIICTSFINIFL
jgi:hypothetical protein